MTRARILVVDDEEYMVEVCADTLRRLGDVEILVETDSRQALDLLNQESLDLVITDIMMPQLNGVDLLRRARELDPNLAILMITAFPKVETAVETLKLGAIDYLTKPFQPDELASVVRRVLHEKGLRDEVRLLSRHTQRAFGFDDMFGRSAAMQNVFHLIEQVADTDFDVLISGETGTGKELVARSIHRRSRRKEARFVPVDCGAIPADLVESEFFGHERGAFTGAHSRSFGLMEYADGGTLFMDELGELPPAAQSKFLRVLQERRLRRVGARQEIPVDVRLIAATSRNLEEEIAHKRFREDLYYRVNVVRIDLPPLRARKDDIPALAKAFITRFAGELGKAALTIDDDAMEVLTRYPWPGNVRELQNFIKRLAALSSHNVLTVADIPDRIVLQADGANGAERSARGFFALREERLALFERDYLQSMLTWSGGEVSKAASEAQLPRSTLYRLLQKHGINPDDYRTAAKR